jgi:hypothetical protein
MPVLAPGRGRAVIALPRWRAALTDHVAALAVAPGGVLVAAGSLGGDSVVLDSLTGTVVVTRDAARLRRLERRPRLVAGTADGAVLRLHLEAGARAPRR